MERKPPTAPQCNGVHPRWSWHDASVIISVRSSISTITALPQLAAKCKGVSPSLFNQFSQLFPADSISNFATPGCPYCAALCKAVFPNLSLLSTLKPDCNNLLTPLS